MYFIKGIPRFPVLFVVMGLTVPLLAQEMRVMPPKIEGQSGMVLECFDPGFSSDQLYEVWRSHDLKVWRLENYYFGQAQTMNFRMTGSPSGREFFRVNAVEQTADGTGAQGSLAAPIDATFPAPEAADSSKVELGRFLFWDKELSGNRNISCATCHHTDLGTGDQLSLPVGEGGTGLGLLRNTGVGADSVHERVPRNAPHIFALGHQSIEVIFHDGRLFRDPSKASGFRTPAGNDFPLGVENVLAAQAMFPVTSATEMAGQAVENTIADLADAGNLPALWEALAQRLRNIPEYVTLFQEVYPEIETAADITFVHAANAIGAYEAVSFKANQSPFDQYLQGNRSALSTPQLRGMKLFYGEANCSSCHSGPLQTDQKFHAIAMPQLGPGKGHGVSGREDWGRFDVTLDPADKHKFRTPTLRNVTLTGPYGHSGAYVSLEEVVRHHLDPVQSLEDYDQTQFAGPSRADLDAVDFFVMNDAVARQSIIDANELETIELTDEEIADLIEFLGSLTDTSGSGLLLGAPTSVPSGLPVAD